MIISYSQKFSWKCFIFCQIVYDRNRSFGQLGRTTESAKNPNFQRFFTIFQYSFTRVRLNSKISNYLGANYSQLKFKYHLNLVPFELKEKMHSIMLKNTHFWLDLWLKIRPKLRWRWPKLRGSAELDFRWFGRSLLSNHFDTQNQKLPFYCL